MAITQRPQTEAAPVDTFSFSSMSSGKTVMFECDGTVTDPLLTFGFVAGQDFSIIVQFSPDGGTNWYAYKTFTSANYSDGDSTFLKAVDSGGAIPVPSWFRVLYNCAVSLSSGAGWVRVTPRR